MVKDKKNNIYKPERISLEKLKNLPDLARSYENTSKKKKKNIYKAGEVKFEKTFYSDLISDARRRAFDEREADKPEKEVQQAEPAPTELSGVAVIPESPPAQESSGGVFSQDDIADLFAQQATGGQVDSGNYKEADDIQENIEHKIADQETENKKLLIELEELRARLQEKEGENKKEKLEIAEQRDALLAEKSKFQAKMEVQQQNLKSIKDQVEKECAQLKEESRLETEKIKRDAYEEGFSQGEAEGFSKGESDGLSEGRLEFTALIREVQLIIDELKSSRYGLLVSSEKQMVKLAMSIARKIVSYESKVNPEVILHNLKSAIRRLSEGEKAVIRLNQKDKSLVDYHKKELLGSLRSMENVKIVVDDLIQAGGCLIETDLGNIDATIDSQMEILEARLIETITDKHSFQNPREGYAQQEESDGGTQNSSDAMD
ncbi:FliH/SctL family protein [Candidatus Riflebacteria bacterium]